MAEFAVRTTGLRKVYQGRRGRHVAVQGLDLNVPVGGVHGFLGPNGSGKTTSLRMLLGLIRADGGTMEIFDRAVPEHLPEVISRVGAIVESPKFFPAFSGRRNLSLLTDAIGTERSAVDRVLEETSLRDRADDPFKSYSLGMKQRLAIAATLLKSPDLLIFDEPTNGLDPAGIHEIRRTMRALADEGRTVLVSSHILSEIQQIADTVSIIGQGRLLAEGSVAELMARGASGAVIRTTDDVRARELLSNAGVSLRAEHDHLVLDDVDDPARISELLAAQQIWLRELRPTGHDLESVFLELTRSEGLEATGGVR
ncbi:ATP-binding cassette domain-containing protein [Yimella sp. cx-51]|uniref:ATP-binding cassette domain-containing protein n=1 Tax=Yimella sp. cx-51 TaxID=2770551 RepID=UPI00165E93AE|nr:ATP-binding cassette domain-containing protein [Yimella sp. cx-51]MBC9956656.1 ATP-binding cassette domain-containing protein [Yimella sp. cx-51]QTH38897.1 ATP-binding cassette domain-containing protein [Yimella sp. cx-51]